MSQRWLGQRERGTRLALRFMVWVGLGLGRSFARALLYPIATYYVVFHRRVSAAVRPVLEQALGHPVRARDHLRHYHCFASTLLDRIYLLTDRYHYFQLGTHGSSELEKCLNRGQGCLLIGSHLGSFEIVRAFGFAHRKLLMKFLMYEEHAPMVRECLHRLNPDMAGMVIPSRLPDTMIRVKECLDQGGLVGLLGDRVVGPEKVVRCEFFGRRTAFPAGPMLVASIVKVPVFLFFGLYAGGNRYEVYLEPFAECVAVSRQARDRDIQMWTQRYARRVEHYCRLSPYNWFNFYDYWHGEG